MRTKITCLSGLLALGLTAACEDEPPPDTLQPDPPVVQLPDVVCATPVILSGMKQSSTAVLVDGTEVVPLDESTTFMASIDLQEGSQSIGVVVRSATGETSTQVRLTTVLDLTAPAAPTVDMVPFAVQETSLMLTGGKEAGTSISINGAEVVPLDDSLTWSATVQLTPETQNNLIITARDNCQESEGVTVSVFQDPTGIGLRVDDPESPTCLDRQTIRGDRAPGVAVELDGREIVAEGEGAWETEVTLQPGINTFSVVGVFGGRESAPREVTIEYDATPPAPPVVSMAPEFTCETNVSIAGTKDANTGIVINDVVVVEQTDTTMQFSVETTLMEGENLLQVDSRDFCERTSGNPTLVRITLDTTPPVVTLDTPIAGDTVTGLVTVMGETMDNTEVEQVEISVDGTPIAMVTPTPPVVMGDNPTYEATWNSAMSTDASHLLSVVAIDRAGKRSTPVTIMVTVSNNALEVSDDSANPPATPETARSVSPAITVMTNNQTAVVWRDNNDLLESGNDDDILLRLYNQGTMSIAPLLVSSHGDDGRSQNPDVAPGANDNAHIIWQDDGDIDGDGNVESDIIYRQFTASALATEFVVLSTDLRFEDGRSSFPAVASDGMGNAHVVWQDDGDLDGDGVMDNDIYYSFQGGGGWSQPVLVSDAMNDGVSARPSIAITPDNCPHIVWQDSGDIAPSDQDGMPDIYYRGSTPNNMGGCTFGNIVIVSEEAAIEQAILPVIAADPSDPLGLLWVTFASIGDVANNGTDRDVFLRNIFNNLTGRLILVTDAPADGLSGDPYVVVDANTNVHVAFTDTGNIGGNGADLDVYLRTWNGQMLTQYSSVSDVGQNSFNIELSRTPAMAANGTVLYLVWEDQSDYDGDMIPDSDIVYLIRN